MWDSLTSAVITFIGSILNLLPDSPFLALENLSNTDYYQWLKWVNWFVPINTFISILEAWLVGIGLYYLYQIVLRWVKAIE
jgi:hypothetical protein